MANYKQCSDHQNTGLGVGTPKLPRLSSKAPALKGGQAPKGVPTSKQGQ